MANFAWTLILIILLAEGVTVFGSICSRENRSTNMAACLNAIEDTLFDNSKYWFGDSYTARCPNGIASGMSCMNFKPSGTNLALRTFTNTSLARNVDRFLELHFRSGGKNYTACGNHFLTKETWSMDVDPTSDVIVYPWYVRHFPENVDWDYTPGDLFTLMAYDIAYMVSHGIYVNIQGDDMSTAEVIKAYHGPLVSTDMDNPYTFMLFKQNGRVTVSQEWKNKVNNENWGAVWTIDEFIDAVNIQEMVAINWIVATGDEYAAENMMRSRATVTCPAYVTKALHQKPRPFIPQDAALSVWMDIEFMAEGGNLTVCCKQYTYEQRNFKLNPIGKPIFNTYEVRTGTPYKLSMMKMGIYTQATNFSGDMYTLITLDPDVPYPSFATEERPLLHGMVVNIMNGDISTGDVGLAYQGPAPPDNKPHYYYFLLYKQQVKLNATNMLNYVGANCGTRCLYNINVAVSENNLELVGATWMRATTDEYVIYRNIQRGDDEAQQCLGQEGYKNPCPSVCSRESRSTNMPACLKAIEDTLFDNSKYWFGDSYTSRCPNGIASGMSCMNFKPSGTNLALRTFTNTSLARNVDRFLELHFRSGGKNYTACGNHFLTNETWSMDADPTSDVIVYPWYVRHFPENVDWDYSPGDLFTLMAYDIAYMVSHGIYVNIQGDDMSTAEVIKAYHGPLVSTDMDNPYTFMLFKQNGRVTVSQEWKNKVNNENWGAVWTIDEFIDAVNIQEMVAINWIVATGDEYAAENMMRSRATVTCPAYVTKALHQKPRPFIPQDAALSVWMDIEFMAEGGNLTVCCKQYTYEQRNFKLNPIGNPIFNTYEVRTGTPYKLSMMKMGIYTQATNFSGDMYTLITLDPDVPYPSFATEERPLLHGMVVNIMDGDISTGDVGLAYQGPAPPDNKPHYYYFLLYKQQVKLNATNMLNYVGDNCGTRCLYNINVAVSENNLELVGATWMRATTDEYVIYRNIQRGDDEAQQCLGQEGYKNPCPSVCSRESRSTNMAACLKAIEDTLFDNSKYWFGDSYTARCPNGIASGMACMNFKPSGTNLALRTFTNTSLARNVDRFLELHYRSGGKNYTACGNHFLTKETWSMDVDPTTDVIVYPWYVRHFPENVDWDYTPGDLFTLMAYDIAYMVSHGIYVNIQGDDMLTAEVIKAYHGPLVSTDMHNPYTFMLFKQNGRVTVSQEWKNKVNNENWGAVWTIDEFIDAVNIQEMVAVNWIVATGDEYAAEAMMDRRATVTCPVYVTKALHQKPRPFIPQDAALSVWMDIEFMAEGGNLTVCCKQYTYEQRNFKLNPIGNPIFNTYEVRSGTPYKLSMMKMGIYAQATDFSGDWYTMITLDPDVPSSTAGTEERPLLHGLITNIMDGNVSTGHVGMAYSGPAPPDNKPHYYYTLLYKQKSPLNATEMINYADSSCSGGLVGRCLFDINRLVSENNLTLVGATWFRSTTDEYVHYRQIAREPIWEADICKRAYPGYIDPTCPVASAVALGPSAVAFYIVCFIITNVFLTFSH